MDSGVISVFGANPTLPSIALGAIILVILGFMTGQIVPKWTVKSLLEARNERVAMANTRADDYKKMYETTNAALTAAQGQITELLVVGQTTKKFVEALPVPSTGGVQS